nr:plasmalemma vesicle-associated protein isoform X2 [Anas platyrhynchos]
MEKSGYTMAKFGLETKEAMPRRDCGFYMKYVFLFTSLIQFLIILGLVLFMVYGNAHAGTDTHLRLLEEQLQDRYNKIITLGGRNANLTRALNTTLKEKQGLQGTLQKVQRELDKCNSSQLPNATPKMQEMMKAIFIQKVMLDDYRLTVNLINANCSAEKAQLRSQLDQTALARKELENNCAKGSAELAKTKQEHEGCQQELLRTKTELTATKSQLELPKHECNLLRSEFSIPLQRIRETINPYSCGSTHEELRRLAQRAEDFFLQQKSREAVYQEKVACELNLLQCQFNGTRLKQELEKRLQEADKQLKGGQEEKKKLLAEKEQLSKELGEKSKAALQSNYLKQQLSICEGAKRIDAFDLTGLWGSVRPGTFASPNSYTDSLRNPSIFSSIGKMSMEEMERFLQKLMEPYVATPRNPSG